MSFIGMLLYKIDIIFSQYSINNAKHAIFIKRNQERSEQQCGIANFESKEMRYLNFQICSEYV